MLRPVSAWMTAPAIVVPVGTCLPRARALMRMHRIRRLPVVDRGDTLIGIVTEGDINRISDSASYDVRAINLYHTAADLPVGDFMTTDLVTVPSTAPISLVAQLMIRRRIGGVPVVDNGRLVGMITESDLFRALIADETEEPSLAAALPAEPAPA